MFQILSADDSYNYMENIERENWKYSQETK